ncbi:hypothetical protein CCR75_001999 [Bremia lactucae]|uniref:Mitochondrial distribution and morphology protein 35 n=1 Tax=Bremia lactucae TaxID=4779 RepID=A0A976FRC5_BRELC|nr:hypothetical protein CCR75_001999 [Bremia lactucae]
MEQQEPMQHEQGCWQEKAVYDQCFDTWYANVFLQQKAHGKLGCQKEYEAYTQCYLAELNTNKVLMDNIKSIMQPNVRERFEEQEVKRQQGKKAKE